MRPEKGGTRWCLCRSAATSNQAVCRHQDCAGRGADRQNQGNQGCHVVSRVRDARRHRAIRGSTGGGRGTRDLDPPWGYACPGGGRDVRTIRRCGPRPAISGPGHHQVGLDRQDEQRRGQDRHGDAGCQEGADRSGTTRGSGHGGLDEGRPGKRPFRCGACRTTGSSTGGGVGGDRLER